VQGKFTGRYIPDGLWGANLGYRQEKFRSNIMTTLYDSKTVPKITDLGIAKARWHRLTEKTFFTEY
jgi:hypothetical protein